MELDLEHYVVPAPTTSANSGQFYAANLTETPRSMNLTGTLSNSKAVGGASHSHKDNIVSTDRPGMIKVVLFIFLISQSI